MLPSGKGMRYESTVKVASQCLEGVHFNVFRMSLARRIELARRVRELWRQAEFHAAGNEPLEKLEASVLADEVNRLYLRWGLESVEGLLIDGREPTVEDVVNLAPEEFSREVIEAIKKECGLSTEERKNS